MNTTPAEHGTGRRGGPLRVLIFSRDPAWYGGVVNFTALLMRKIDRRVEFDHLQIGQRRGNRSALRRVLQPLLDALELARKLRRNRYDVIHLNPSINRASMLRDSLFLLVLRLFRANNVLVFIRGWDDDYFARLRAGFFGRRVVFRLFRGAAGILVLGERFRRELVEVGFDPGKIGILSTMFDGELLQDVQRRRSETPVQLLFLSRLVSDKGIFELLEAVRQCVNEGMNMQLVMAGEGEDAERARSWVAENRMSEVVTFPGYLRGEDKAQALVDADLFVFPTYYGEGCPNALLEAMGAGLPVIATRAGGIPDVVEHNVNGIILDRVSPESIRAALLVLVPDAGLRGKISETNRRKAWQNYEASVVSGRLENIYADIAAAAGRARAGSRPA